ncbi:MAG: hypothetical protein WCL51_00545 [Bacteroidota bacterium]|jgi:hypothetical protein
MKYIIAIDDTDNLDSRGTGHLARTLAAGLEERNLAIIENVTRHQLYVHENIPFTSHNSSASIVVEVVDNNIEEVIEFCRQHLLQESAIGSDAGLCIAAYDKITDEVVDWGKRAKCEILTKENAHKLADKTGIYLEGLTGELIGVIGSLAAVGLRFDGNDGRVLWIKNLRELTGTFTIAELNKVLKIDAIVTKEYLPIPEASTIIIEAWPRPVVINKKVTLIVEKTDNNEEFQFRSAPKEFIKSITE